MFFVNKNKKSSGKFFLYYINNKSYACDATCSSIHVDLTVV